MASPLLLKMTAWPQALVLNAAKAPIGLIMPRLVGYRDIHHLYSPKSRKSEFPEADFNFLVYAAANIARAFASVHDAGCVIGDVNHGGVTVADNATIKLIDCDSFQIAKSGQTFCCDVGVSTFTPPELQGRSLKGQLRTKEQDYFGLAILVFHLLIMGRHPFAGRYLGRGDMPVETAIQQLRYAYGQESVKLLMQPPPNAPALISLSPEIAELFERAFTAKNPKQRPDPRSWVSRLDELGKALVRCKVSPRHAFAVNATSCPWCQIEAATGVQLFNVVLRSAVRVLDIMTLWRSIGAVALPTFPPPPREQDVAVPPPSARAKRLASQGWVRFLKPPVLIGGLPFLLGGLNAVAPNLFLLWLGCAAGLIVVAQLKAVKSPVQRFTTELTTAEQSYQEAQHRYADFLARHLGASGPFMLKKKQLEAQKQAWDALSAKRAEGLRKLEKDRRNQQLDKYLSNFFIDHAAIAGIGPGRKATLASYGIQTAADVQQRRLLAVPGFGQVITKKLMDWRRQLERRFKFRSK